MFKRNCPSCNIEMSYKSEVGVKYANSKNSTCRDCGFKKQSEKRKGKKFTTEHKEKLSNAKKGMTLTTEHKINIGNSVRGLIRSDESKIRYSKSKMGDKNPCKRQDVKDKIRKSIINLYKANPGIKNRISKSVSKFFLESPDFVSLDELESYEKFRKLVNNLTKRVKKELLENWNGLDYYDNIEIKDNFRLHYNNENYPTIDHKISILEGYKKGYQPEEISSIDNLCLTKRKLNTQKGFKSEQAFKDLL